MLDNLKIPSHDKGNYVFTDILDDEIRMSDILRFVVIFINMNNLNLK